MTASISESFTGTLTSIAQITSSTTDPNMANNTSATTIEDVLPPSGLADTGLDMVLIIAGSFVLTATAVTTIVWRRRHFAKSISADS